LVKGDCGLIKYQTNKEEILRAKSNALIHKANGYVFFGAGLFTGKVLVNKGTTLLEKPKKRERLNEFLQKGTPLF
jgi:hypothetical protein